MNQMPCDKLEERQGELLAALKAARDSIATIDAQILDLISQRQQVARRIGKLKGELDKPVVDGEVEGLVLTRNSKHARKLGLSLASVHALTELLMELAKKEQREGREV